MRIAIVPAVFNRPDALAALLEGYLAQTDANFEIAIADDGSADDTRKVIEAYQARAPFPIRHAWQKNEGYRAATIRNKAVALTDADYIVYTDGDCIPRADFVAQHRRLAERGWFLAGNRVLLSEPFTQRVLGAKLPLQCWPLSKWLGAWARRDINRWLPLLRLPDGAFRKRSPQRWRGAKTCNLSVWRADLLAVNGMDESYAGWGMEDSDLVVRLMRAGIKRKSARCAAPVFHLWHRENDRRNLAENQRRLQAILQSERVAAAQGLDQYL